MNVYLSLSSFMDICCLKFIFIKKVLNMSKRLKTLAFVDFLIRFIPRQQNNTYTSLISFAVLNISYSCCSLTLNVRGEAASYGGHSECNALLTRGISFIMASLCLSLRCSVRPFRPSGSHLHYILDRQDIHAFLTHCPSPRGESPERDVRTPGWALCPSALFTHPAGDFLSGVTETCVV